jgi:hypothetical protein
MWAWEAQNKVPGMYQENENWHRQLVPALEAEGMVPRVPKVRSGLLW